MQEETVQYQWPYVEYSEKNWSVIQDDTATKGRRGSWLVIVRHITQEGPLG